MCSWLLGDFLHTVIQGPRTLCVPSTRRKTATTYRELQMKGIILDLIHWGLPECQAPCWDLPFSPHNNSFVKKPGFGKAHTQFWPTRSQILNHSTPISAFQLLRMLHTWEVRVNSKTCRAKMNFLTWNEEKAKQEKCSSRLQRIPVM